ncbi:MAG: Ldh family oxidoreductase [Planctomycetaceae bacterium]
MTTSRIFPSPALQSLGEALFAAAGASREEARVVAGHLVESSLLGHDSHGILRLPEYLGFVADGSIVPGAKIAIDRRSPTSAVIDCGHGFGPVGGVRAVELASELARDTGTGCVVTRRCNHVARLGAYVQAAADKALVALAFCNSPIHGHFVLPAGGREGRLATNPIAYAFPTDGDPILADFSTSVAPEGKIRVYRNRGETLPEGWVQDADGQPTTDPERFYGSPRGGILPLGGVAAHKGYALGLLVELLASTLAGLRCDDPGSGGNGVCFLVIDPLRFVEEEEYRRLVAGTRDYMKTSAPAPGIDEVLVPGELEFRTKQRRMAEGIPVDPVAWEQIVEHAQRLGVPLPGPAEE